MPAPVMPELQSQHWTRSALGTHQPSSTAATQCYPTTAAQCQPQSCLSYKVSTGHAVHLVLLNTYHALGALDLQHMARPGQLDGGSRTPPLQPQNPICWFWTLDSESTCKGTIRPTQCHGAALDAGSSRHMNNHNSCTSKPCLPSRTQPEPWTHCAPCTPQHWGRNPAWPPPGTPVNSPKLA